MIDVIRKGLIKQTTTELIENVKRRMCDFYDSNEGDFYPTPVLVERIFRIFDIIREWNTQEKYDQCRDFCTYEWIEEYYHFLLRQPDTPNKKATMSANMVVGVASVLVQMTAVPHHSEYSNAFVDRNDKTADAMMTLSKGMFSKCLEIVMFASKMGYGNPWFARELDFYLHLPKTASHTAEKVPNSEGGDDVMKVLKMFNKFLPNNRTYKWGLACQAMKRKGLVDKGMSITAFSQLAEKAGAKFNTVRSESAYYIPRTKYEDRINEMESMIDNCLADGE